MSIDIILRTCDRINSLHCDNEGNNDRLPGPKFTKLDIITRCMHSLIISMNKVSDNLKFIVVDDHSSSEGVKVIKQLMDKCIHPSIFIGAEDKTSLNICYNWALTNSKDLIYFVEDDYLHDPICIEEMIYEHTIFKEGLNHEVAIFPSDNVDNYRDVYKNSVPCHMTLGRTRHWRTVANATYTFMCSKNILERYWYLFELAGEYTKSDVICEDNTTNVIWEAPYKDAGGAYLLSPIPSLALHFHFKDHIIPYINWKEWWERNHEIF